MTESRKLIEVALPLEAINRESAREKEPFTRQHPRSMHVWWSRKPLAACRAVLFAQLVDDPSAHPERFPTQEDQQTERQRLFDIIERLLSWESRDDQYALEDAKHEIAASWDDLPIIVDPFCGGGSIAVEAQRLGLSSFSSDVNPVAVLMTKAQVELPSRLRGIQPVHPKAAPQLLNSPLSAYGLAADVRCYGSDLLAMLHKHVGSLFPDAEIDGDQGPVSARVIAWLWVRTVTCPNPACRIPMPLANNWWLSKKSSRRQWVEPVVREGHILYTIASGAGSPPAGTVANKAVTCLVCGTKRPLSYVREEGLKNGLGMEQIAIVAEAERGRMYLPPSRLPGPSVRIPDSAPRAELPKVPRYISPPLYGMKQYRDLFTPRQLATLDAAETALRELRSVILQHALAGGLEDDGVPLSAGGDGARAYSEAVIVYLALAISRWTAFFNCLASWNSTNENIGAMFALQTVSMSWNFAEVNPFVGSPSLKPRIDAAVSWIDGSQFTVEARAELVGAARVTRTSCAACISTDPPYFDNIGYGNLADTFYVWLRRFVGEEYPELFGTLVSPKSEELLQDGTVRDDASLRKEFERRLGEALERLHSIQTESAPLVLFYAYKQSEASEGLLTSTGWEAMLSSVIEAGFKITGTWPLRTERVSRARGQESNALASSVVIVCRARAQDVQSISGREFRAELRVELPIAVRMLQQSSLAPVDLAQAAIGPGMAVLSRYSKVVEADGSAMSVRTALGLINEVLDETLAEQEADFDSDTRWAVAWFEQNGMNPGPFGMAETLSKAKNTAINGLVAAGILESRAGKVRLLEREELFERWDPAADTRLTVWEVAQYLIRALESGGESGAAALLRRVGGLGETAREVAYRLYVICERKKWTKEALAYNGLVVAWPEISRLAAAPAAAASPVQGELL